MQISKHVPLRHRLSVFNTLILIGAAETWFNTLEASLTAIHQAFINRLKPPPSIHKSIKASHHSFDLIIFTQGEKESIEEFIHRLSYMYKQTEICWIYYI